ncbi:hypothetical protein SBRCBS47491_004756 [Sporothrix bragantina]|uniref:RNA-dependent RNA polymerase n=1 Tax=Sporothrix bragantina TaxID=671064 RepID=A0ABP0BR14_9PEZI
MEVFLQNLPAEGDLSDRGLLLQLQPFMRKLGIADHSYDCEKAAKKRYAFITFAREIDAIRFLDVHGEVEHKPTRNGRNRDGGQTRNRRTNTSRLYFLGAHVMCRLSDRPANRTSLGVLAARAEKVRVEREQPQSPPKTAQPAAATSSTAAATRHTTVFDNSMTISRLSCGYYKYVANGQLAFVPEYVASQSQRSTSMADFGKRHLTLKRGDEGIIYIPLSTIQEIVWSPHGNITLTLSSVPLFFSTAIIGRRMRLTALDDRHAVIVGMCLVYQIKVVPENLARKMKRLSDFGGLTVTRYEVATASGFDVADSEAYLRSLLSTHTASKSLPFSVLVQLQALSNNGYLHPNTVARVVGECVRIHKETPITPEAMKQLMQAIDWPTPNHHDPSEFEVNAMIDYLLETEQNIAKGHYLRAGLTNPGGNLTAIHRVMVTPTHMTLHGPELENKNRVLRKYPNHHDHFIRVQFCDEDGQALRLNGKVEYILVYARFRKVMVEGIQVAGRTYKFLGWSHSSLRSHSMWFVAPFVDDNGNLQSHLSIISMLGNFDQIGSPARCAARIGQAFSETPFAISLAEHKISVYRIPDVTSLVDNTRLFSDGVGTISLEAAQCIWKQLPRGKKQPTCFQIRYAGAKGMLSLDTRLDGRQIRLRPSMIKFESSENTNLEICDMAVQPISLYLNRQLIKILEDMGVPTEWFQQRQEEAVRELRLITSSPYNMASFLKAQSVATSIKLHKLLLLADRLGLDFRSDAFLRRATDAVILRELRLLKHKARMLVPNGVTLFGVMDETGFLQEGEVYIAFDAPNRGSKSRRFPGPPANGAPVIVTRSPALHPGDIQMACNTHPPLHDKNGRDHPLRALNNCIVFSSYGVRDLPSQLSGGDLDGDIFNVIWDTAICGLPSLQMFEPADYPRQEAINIGRPVTTEDIADFFIDFLRTDHLGAIATRHMILADQLRNGTLDESCVKTAEMHSTAVDFSKTGIPAELKNLPKANRSRPDFLSPGPIVQIYSHKDIDPEQFTVKDDNDEDEEDQNELDAPRYKYYRSIKTLGTLYRAIDERQIWQDVQVPPTDESFYKTFLEWATQECKVLGCGDWQMRTDEALRIRAAYDDAMLSTMYEFSEHPTLPLTELEVFIGTIVNKTGAQTLRQRDRSRKLHDEYERISSWITAQMRPHKKRSDQKPAPLVNTGNDDDDGFDSEDDSEDGGVWLDERTAVLELCLACVHAQKLDRGGRKEGKEQVESFWLVAGSALIRELELIRHGMQVDMDLQRDMHQLSMGEGKLRESVEGVEGV